MMSYGCVYNSDTFCDESLGLYSTESTGNYFDGYWSCPPIQSRDPYSYSPVYDDRLKMPNFGDLNTFEECTSSPVTSSTTYSSSPSSIVSQNFVIDYTSFYGANESTGLISRPPVKRMRNTANRKERRRTQSINNAFSDLRDRIPNVPPDTKLSKIKTLRLATSYISYLMGVLNSEDTSAACSDFKADISSHSNRKASYQSMRYISSQSLNYKVSPAESASSLYEEENGKKRTGWPQHVWASELKQEQLS